MIQLIKPQSFLLKKYALELVCTIAVAMLIAYAVLIGLDKIPNLGKTEEDIEESKRQDVINKIFDVLFHILGFIGAVIENQGLTGTFLILTLITKYIAISEAIQNYYFWPYAGWAILVDIVGGVFIKHLRKINSMKQRLAKQCPYCSHCNSFTVGQQQQGVVPLQVAPVAMRYPQQ